MFSNITVYWINLDRSYDRRKNMTDMFSKYKIENIRINGYDGKILNSYKDIECTSYITDCELGCTLSHLTAIKTAYENNEEYAIIMEDDIIIDYCDSWKHKICEIIDIVHDDWEIIKLHCSNFNHIINLLTISNNTFFTPWSRESDSAGCYIINKIGMKKLIDKFWKNKKWIIEQSIAVSEYIIYPNVKTYEYVFPTFIHQVDHSLIHLEHLDYHKKSLCVILEFFNSHIL
jgi:GR25 family glycosyltransferase involved in LPS biosynthesis